MPLHRVTNLKGVAAKAKTQSVAIYDGTFEQVFNVPRVLPRSDKKTGLVNVNTALGIGVYNDAKAGVYTEQVNPNLKADVTNASNNTEIIANEPLRHLPPEPTNRLEEWQNQLDAIANRSSYLALPGIKDYQISKKDFELLKLKHIDRKDPRASFNQSIIEENMLFDTIGEAKIKKESKSDAWTKSYVSGLKYPIPVPSKSGRTLAEVAHALESDAPIQPTHKPQIQSSRLRPNIFDDHLFNRENIQIQKKINLYKPMVGGYEGVSTLPNLLGGNDENKDEKSEDNVEKSEDSTDPMSTEPVSLRKKRQLVKETAVNPSEMSQTPNTIDNLTQEAKRLRFEPITENGSVFTMANFPTEDFEFNEEDTNELLEKNPTLNQHPEVRAVTGVVADPNSGTLRHGDQEIGQINTQYYDTVNPERNVVDAVVRDVNAINYAPAIQASIDVPNTDLLAIPDATALDIPLPNEDMEIGIPLEQPEHPDYYSNSTDSGDTLDREGIIKMGRNIGFEIANLNSTNNWLTSFTDTYLKSWRKVEKLLDQYLLPGLKFVGVKKLGEGFLKAIRDYVTQRKRVIPNNQLAIKKDDTEHNILKSALMNFIGKLMRLIQTQNSEHEQRFAQPQTVVVNNQFNTQTMDKELTKTIQDIQQVLNRLPSELEQVMSSEQIQSTLRNISFQVDTRSNQVEDRIDEYRHTIQELIRITEQNNNPISQTVLERYQVTDGSLEVLNRQMKTLSKSLDSITEYMDDNQVSNDNKLTEVKNSLANLVSLVSQTNNSTEVALFNMAELTKQDQLKQEEFLRQLRDSRNKQAADMREFMTNTRRQTDRTLAATNNLTSTISELSTTVKDNNTQNQTMIDKLSLVEQACTRDKFRIERLIRASERAIDLAEAGARGPATEAITPVVGELTHSVQMVDNREMSKQLLETLKKISQSSDTKSLATAISALRGELVRANMVSTQLATSVRAAIVRVQERGGPNESEPMEIAGMDVPQSSFLPETIQAFKSFKSFNTFLMRGKKKDVNAENLVKVGPWGSDGQSPETNMDLDVSDVEKVTLPDIEVNSGDKILAEPTIKWVAAPIGIQSNSRKRKRQ